MWLPRLEDKNKSFLRDEIVSPALVPEVQSLVDPLARPFNHAKSLTLQYSVELVEIREASFLDDLILTGYAFTSLRPATHLPL